MERPVIAIIGAGAVGATTAYALITRNINAKIVIFDINVHKCMGEMQDLSDALSMSGVSAKAQHRAYDIIAGKGFTSFGIASAIATYCSDIITDARRVVPVSCFIEQFGVCLSIPAVLGLKGIQQILHPALNTLEQEKLATCAQILRQMYESRIT